MEMVPSYNAWKKLFGTSITKRNTHKVKMKITIRLLQEKTLQMKKVIKKLPSQPFKVTFQSKHSYPKIYSTCQSLLPNTRNALEQISLLILLTTTFYSTFYCTQPSKLCRVQMHKSNVIHGFTQCSKHCMVRQQDLN